MSTTMDRLFSRKRSVSRADETDRPATLKKQPSAAALNESFLKRRAEVSDTLSGMRKYSDKVRAGERGAGGVSDKAPSIDVDFRNSLILPGLSQRFSVLLPSLSSAPEDAIRSLLASQRATDGPSLTLEEEEMLIAEMRETNDPMEDEDDWDGHHPILDRDWSSRSLASAASGSGTARAGLSASASSPSDLSDSDAPTPATAPLDTPGNWPISPPPTSTSFSSFKTFGGNDDSPVKIKSYGFSGASAFRDADYIRRAKRMQKSDDVFGKDERADLSVEGTVVISAEDDHQTQSSQTRRALPVSPTVSTTNSSLPDLPVSSPTFGVPQTRVRKSLLANLTPAQVKRISMALGQIEERLHKPSLPDDAREEEAEETLQPAVPLAEQDTRTHTRHPSDTLSEASTSTISSAFPYKASPAGSTPQTKVEAPSPSRLPPSPRTHDLHAHIARPERSTQTLPAQPNFRSEEATPVPVPILTPSRTQPVRHTPSSSLSKLGGQVSSSPGYIPGQPRPVRLGHHSNGSVSSRTDTPTRANPASDRASPSPLSGHQSEVSNIQSSNVQSAGSASSYKTVNLGRSLSVNQGDDRARAPPRDHAGMHFRAQSLDTNLPSRRQSSSLGHGGPSETIEEEEDENSPIDPDLRVQDVFARRNVSDLVRKSSRSERRSVGVRRGMPSGNDDASPVSQQASQYDRVRVVGGFAHNGSSSSPLPQRDSTFSMDSTFAETPSDGNCDDLFMTQAADESSIAPEDENSACEMLRKLSGIGSDELSALQAKLVEKAKAERLALVGATGLSPELPITPAFGPALQGPIPALGPAVRHASQHSLSSQAPSNAASPEMLSGTFSPMSIGSRNVSPTERATILTASRRAAPAPPADVDPTEQPVEAVSQPQAELVERQARKVAPEDDPDVRRDFEARIAAATAALQRAPMVTAPLQRKSTKRGGALVISSPTLVSSSATLSGDALTSTGSPIDPGVAKALEKASGSGGKMSMRWRKLGFKRGPSISNNQEVQNPPASASAALRPQLKEPISLRSNSQQDPPGSAPVAPPSAYKPAQEAGSDLKSFRFPARGGPSQVSRSQSTKVSGSSASQFASGKTRRGRSDDKAHEAIPEGSSDATVTPTLPAQSQFSPPTSNDIAIAKFIEAGRAVGLNDDQLNEMLVAKGMLNRPLNDKPTQEQVAQSNAASQRGSNANGSSINWPMERKVSDTRRLPPSAPAPLPIQPTHVTAAVAPATERKVSGPKALFRSLSRSKKAKADLKDSEIASDTAVEPVPRDVIVRRTILVPQDMPGPNSLLQVASEIASPGRISPRQRQPSIKRKPVNLTREDEALVHGSPPPSTRKVSDATTTSVRSEVENPGLGFLLPGPPLGTPSKSHTGVSESDTHSLAKSSANGSLYDLYRHDEAQETLASPIRASPYPTNGKRQTQAVEITEYADGKVVWSLVDALRDGDEHDEIRFGTPGTGKVSEEHSRTESLDSRRESKADSEGDVFAGPGRLGAGTAGLAFRHRDRGPTAPRPPTDIYFTSSADVADLIDHLSTDLDASRGRIDILPPQNTYDDPSAPLPPTFAVTGDSPNAVSTESGQFEDAPSPRRHIPQPIVVPRFADGSMPQRQLFGPRGLGSTESMGSEPSPSAASFASSTGGISGRTVEDRLQALLDRLKESGARG